MKTKILLIIAVVVLLVVDKVQAVDVDFYTDGVIESGDNYEVVNVWNDAIVDMSGGYLARLRTHDFSTINIYDGNVHQGISSLHSSTVNIYGGILTLDYLDILYSSMLNIYGGDLLVGNSPGFSDLSTVNIYGYGFERGINNLTGFLSDGSSFIFNELFFDEYSHMNLIEVPEPLVAEIDIKPTTFNLASKGKWISCKIWLPEDYNVADVNSYSVFLEDEIGAEWIWFEEEEQVLMAKFSRSALQEMLVGLETPTQVELLVTGELIDGTIFEGTDTIRVIDKGKKSR